jgi:hypothetical protein
MNELKNNISDTGSFFFSEDPHLSCQAGSFRKLLTKYGESGLELDAVALTEFPSRYTFLGDRTILKGIKRSQWFSSVPDNMLPPHAW